MRRILRKIAAKEDESLGDTTTLAGALKLQDLGELLLLRLLLSLFSLLSHAVLPGASACFMKLSSAGGLRWVWWWDPTAVIGRGAGWVAHS